MLRPPDGQLLGEAEHGVDLAEVLDAVAGVVLGPIQYKKCWLQFWLENGSSFWLALRKLRRTSCLHM